MRMPTGLGAAESLYDLPALDQVPLAAKVLSSQTTNGVRIEEISYVSEVWNDKPVVITGKLIIPEKGTNLPAIIGYFDPLVAQRGYAGLSVDYGKAIMGGWYTVKPTPRHSGLYHGAVALIRAVSYLQTRPEVNPEAIGVTGGSINGMMACYLAGVDPRIKATVTEFGCGHIFDTWRWGADLSYVTPADREVFEAQVDPGAYQPRIKAPILFAGGANDFAFFLPVFERSYQEVPAEKRLSVFPGGNHCSPPGMNMGQDGFFAWFDLYLKKQGRPFPVIESVTPRGRDGRLEVVIKAGGPVPITEAQVAFSQEADGEWRSRLWDTVTGRMDGAQWIAEIPVEDPAAPVVVLARVRDERGLTVSAVSQQIDPQAYGIKKPTRRPEPRAALMAGNAPVTTAQGYAWLDGQTTVNWVTQDKRAALKLEPKTNADTIVRLDHLHAVVRWMHGRPNYRLTVWARGQAPATPLWMGFQGQGFEEGRPVELTAEWKAYEFTARLEGARRFTLVPMFKLPAGKAAAPVWIADMAVEVSP